MKFETLVMPESINEEYLIATYYMKSNKEPDLFEWVKLVAADQSAGTWTHVEGETPEVVEKYGAKVINIIPMTDEKACVARIAFPLSNFPLYLSMIIATVGGNVLGQDGIKLIDIELPNKALDQLTGPLIGLDGIRKLLNVMDRPLVGAILKPCIGVAPEISAEGAVKAALGGADVIKDDELLSYPQYSIMEDRVKTVMKRLKSEGKDKSCLYAVNITGYNLIERAKRAIENGANAIMVNYFTQGWGAVEDLIINLKKEKMKIPVFGHCAGAGGLYRSRVNGMGTALVCGKLARLVGMDMPLVYPDSGRFGIETNELVEVHRESVSKMGNIKRSFLTVAGGVHPGTIEYLYNLLGNDTILMAGGGIYGHPDGAIAGAKAVLDAVKAVSSGSSVSEAAKDSAELFAALKFWK